MPSGRETLASIDEALDEIRRRAESLDTQFQRAGAQFAKVRQTQLGLFAQMARIRMQELERGELLQTLDDTDRRVTAMLAERRAAQESLAEDIAAAEELLDARERERAGQQSVVDAAAEAVDAAEAEAQQKLGADPEYRAKLTTTRESDAVADHAEAKAEAAEADRFEKGRPYEADPVFRYLRQRGFGTTSYRAWAPARMLDRWVARSNDFEALRRNYSLLTEIPKRLREHAERMRAEADRDLKALRVLEQGAAEAAAVPQRQDALEAAEQRLDEMDRAIEEQESLIDSLMQRRSRFAAGEDEYSEEGAKLLSRAFEHADLQTLRERVARTRSEEDDRLVDEFEELEDQRERLHQDLTQYRRLHEAQRERMLGLEDVRKRFKSQRFDDLHSVFVNGALIAALLEQFVGGSAGVDDVWEAIKRQQRFRRIAANPYFGTGGFPHTRFPPPWRMPGGGKWGGGRKGGGGFGGGGFGRGGGFGGGGFRSGGGF